MDAAYLFAQNFRKVAYENLPPEIVEITKKEVLDTLAVAVAGTGQPGPRELLELVREWGGKKEASVVGCKQRVPAPNAAQVNATLVHTRDYDDVHEMAVMHPGVVTVPVALAMAELKGGLSGKELIAAIALGVDMICRLGLATRPGVSPIKTGWHFTTLYGYPTAALTAGKVLGLDEEQMVNAFGIAYHQCAGNGQCVTDGALTKRMGPGFSARGGVTAALLAQKGVTGAKNSLEGENGLYRVYHHGEYDRGILTRDLGSYFEGINLSIKPYPCCRGIHPSIDAALALKSKYSIDPKKVKEITIATGEANYTLLCTPFDAKVKPRNPVDAQFSIPWGIATVIAKGQVAMKDYTPEEIKNPIILELTGKLKAEIDHSLDNARGIEPARVKVVMDNGDTFVEQVQLALGTPSRPMSFDDCVKKFEDIVSFAGKWMKKDRMNKAIDLTAKLEKVENVTELMALFT
ncbi:MAG TPA: MmgE/PrpD family protein [Syntrophorhabdaceae bacterium]|nr:MmgE/PrpD family protein [Syntrophorhabdaceae bacterium]